MSTLLLFVGGMALSCSDEEGGNTPNPNPVPPNPTPIEWSEGEVIAGERGVSIKVTKTDPDNFVFECVPGSKIQSYRLDVYPLCRMYNYLFENGGVGVDWSKREELILDAIFNSEGAGGYTFNEESLKENYKKAEFNWKESIYAQAEIVPDAEYLIIAVGCNDKEGKVAADVSICHLTTPQKELIGKPRVDIDIDASYKAVGITYIPNSDCKYFYQFCMDKEVIDAYIDAYGEKMYKEFVRHYTITPEDAIVDDPNLLTYVVDFGYDADPEKEITATSIGLDANKTPGEYIRQDFHLKKGEDIDAVCSLEVTRIGATIIELNRKLEASCSAMFYRLYTTEEWKKYENADEKTLITLARDIDQSGWGVANENFQSQASYEVSDQPFELTPNTSYVIVYVGRNGYGDVSPIKVTEPFTTKPLIIDRPQDCSGDLNITISDPGRTELKLTYTYTGDVAMIYHQYLMMTDLNDNRKAMIEYLMSQESNTWNAKQCGEVSDFTWTELKPATEYDFAYIAEDWNGVISEVKHVKGTTEAIKAGPNPQMKLEGYMSPEGNFTVNFSIVKDVARYNYAMIEDEYSASGDYSYNDCMEAWKEECMNIGLPNVNSTTMSSNLNSDRVVALCVPIGENEDGTEKVGDLYAIIYDKVNNKIIEDLSTIFPDAPKPSNALKAAQPKPQVIKLNSRVPAQINAVPAMKTPVAASSTPAPGTKMIYLDMKKLGRHPLAK
ncbi:hypothetical protein [Bacteroides sp.]